MNRRRLRQIAIASADPTRDKHATTAHMLRVLADRVESGEVKANFNMAFTPNGEVWMLSALVPSAKEEEP